MQLVYSTAQTIGMSSWCNKIVTHLNTEQIHYCLTSAIYSDIIDIYQALFNLAHTPQSAYKHLLLLSGHPFK